VPVWSQRKRARLADDTLDPFEKSQQSPVPGVQQYGSAGVLGAVIYQGNAASRALAKMGLEMAFVPAMSSETERAFSRYVFSYFYGAYTC